jgi:histidinol-phosphate phosphatase family protein
VTERPRQAVILAGGRGSRLRPLTDTRPKAMVPFHGKPFLEYLLEMLRDQGFERALLLLGYLPDVIIDHFGGGHAIGIDVEYAVTAPEDLTAHRVQDAADRLDDLFLLMYCDNYWPLQFDRMWSHYQRLDVPAMVTVYANGDGYSRDSVIVDDRSMVRVFDRGRTTPGLRGVEISYAILDKATVLPLLPEHQELFEQAVYPPLAERGVLGAYWTEHRYYSVGGHERLPLTDEFLARRPAIILDRDGVLNVRPARAQYVTRPEEFVWLPGALDALCRLTAAGYRIAVVSNQAGVARGVMTDEDLGRVTQHMVDTARAVGARITATYSCPHGWDDGCHCRKPQPGMLFQAQRDLSLDLTRTMFVGDDERDGQAAHAAGAPFAMVTDDTSLLDIVKTLPGLVDKD